MRFKLQEYNSLKLHQKAVLLGNSAVFLLNFFETGIAYSLYSYNDYYLEVLIDDRTNDLLEITAFKDLAILDKYLSNISLPALL